MIFFINPLDPESWFNWAADWFKTKGQDQLTAYIDELANSPPVDLGVRWFQDTISNTRGLVVYLIIAIVMFAGIWFMLAFRRLSAGKPARLLRDALMAAFYAIIVGFVLNIAFVVEKALTAFISAGASPNNTSETIEFGPGALDLGEAVAQFFTIWVSTLIMKETSNNYEVVFLVLLILSFIMFPLRGFNALTMFIWRLNLVGMVVTFFLNPIYAFYMVIASSVITDPDTQSVPGAGASAVAVLTTMAVLTPAIIILLATVAWTIVEGEVQASTSGDTNINDMPDVSADIEGKVDAKSSNDTLPSATDSVKDDVSKESQSYTSPDTLPDTPVTRSQVDDSRSNVVDMARQHGPTIAAAAATGGSSAAITAGAQVADTEVQKRASS